MTRRSERPGRGAAAGTGRVGGRWRLRNWRLRTKLLAMLLIPSVAVLALVGLRAKADLDRAAGFAEAAERVRVDGTVAEVVHQLQRERDLTVRHVAEGRQGPRERLLAQQDRVDAAIGAFDRTLTASRHGLSAAAVDAFRRITQRLDQLTGLRYAGRNTDMPAEAVLRAYSEMISGVLDVGDRAVSRVADGDLARSRLAANALARVKDQMSVKRAIVAEALARGRLPEDRERALLAAEAELDAARGDFLALATPRQQRMYTDTVIGLVVDLGNGIVESVLTQAGTDAGFENLSAREWDTSATYTVNLADQVQEAMLAQIQRRSDALAADARRSAALDAGIVLGALLVAAVLAVVITRSLVRPVRALRASALDVAENRLPAAVEDILTEEHPRPEDTATRAVDPVPVHTREELGEVARAFDAVHGEAVRLAGEQAMLRENVNSMFVNLSRRSQDLVERQLGVLDRMEEHEQDPDILGGLFELDHLATRMRRNSENLLVLAGEDAGRPLPGSVPADEIIGAALSEVEDYKRIKVAVTPNLSVPGDAAADLIHVVSELFENATAYSPEHEPVSVVSSVGADREWRIDITDRGAGMPDTEIRRANERLADPPEVDVEVSRRMGLYVVGRLARRHRIGVRLAAADLRGLTATVVVPAELVEFDPETALGRPQRAQAQQVRLTPVELGPPRSTEPVLAAVPDGDGPGGDTTEDTGAGRVPRTPPGDGETAGAEHPDPGSPGRSDLDGGPDAGGAVDGSPGAGVPDRAGLSVGLSGPDVDDATASERTQPTPVVPAEALRFATASAIGRALRPKAPAEDGAEASDRVGDPAWPVTDDDEYGAATAWADDGYLGYAAHGGGDGGGDDVPPGVPVGADPAGAGNPGAVEDPGALGDPGTAVEFRAAVDPGDAVANTGTPPGTGTAGGP
ncbi:nitrate- and nitrite sensing domain-containing protein, partial [Saccharomonospora iraqiensis]|uniref:nitrate- and nitrite sensing domain-containing protein n=1 Tax=Saccharomonospora iraqiensis TaxID=52698 RepID=UPI0018DE87C1